MIPHCFNLLFPEDIWCGFSFHVLTCFLYIFFGELFGKVFGLFFRWVFAFLLFIFKTSLYILDNSHLSDVSFANIFSQPVICLLILLVLSFAEQKFCFTEVQPVNYFFDESCLWYCTFFFSTKSEGLRLTFHHLQSLW